MGRGARLFLLPGSLHLLLALAFLTTFPPFRAPDEGAHLNYALHLIRSGRFPVFQGMEGRVTYEAHQPPLFYLTAAPFLVPWSKEGEENRALFVARLSSSLWGLLTVGTATALAFVLIADPASRTIGALIAGLFAALHPVHLLISGSVTNDSAAGATAGAALLWICFLLMRGVRSRLPLQSSVDGLITGTVCGLALLAKSSNIFFFLLGDLPVITLLAGVGPIRRKGRTHRHSPLMALLFLSSFFLSFALSAGWWLVRNLRLYGDPLAMAAFLEGFRQSPGPQYFFEKAGLTPFQYAVLVSHVSWFTWLGIFAEPNEVMKGLARISQGEEPTLSFVLTACAIGFWLLIPLSLGVVRSFAEMAEKLRKGEVSQGLALILPFLTLIIVLAEFVAFNIRFFQGQARYWYAAHPAMAYLYAVGLIRLLPTQPPARLVSLTIGTLITLSLIVLFIWVPTVGLDYR